MTKRQFYTLMGILTLLPGGFAIGAILGLLAAVIFCSIIYMALLIYCVKWCKCKMQAAFHKFRGNSWALRQ